MKNKSITRDKLCISEKQAKDLYDRLAATIDSQLNLIRQDFLESVKEYLEVWLHRPDDLEDDVQQENLHKNESKIAMDV